MNSRSLIPNRIAVAIVTAAALVVIALPSPAARTPRAAAKEFFRQTNLVSDQAGVALIHDPNLVNPWGISMSGGSPFWVANNGTGTATLYAGDANGNPLTRNTLVVQIPGGSPTGTVLNSSADFVVHSG